MANPITSVAPGNSPITSVDPSYAAPRGGGDGRELLLTRLVLDLRGERFLVERETLLNLPESVLLGMFPNGLIMCRPQMGGDLRWPTEDDDEESQVFTVDVSHSHG